MRSEQLGEVWGLKPEAAERLMPMFHTGRGVYHTLCADTATWFELKNHPLHRCEGCQRNRALQAAPSPGFT